MPGHVCSIVPPYLLRAIAESHKDEPAGQAAAETLATMRATHRARKEHFRAKLSRNIRQSADAPAEQGIVPRYLLEQIIAAEGIDDEVKQSARETIATSQQAQGPGADAAGITVPTAPAVPVKRGVYNMNSRGGDRDRAGDQLLPGTPTRVEGQTACGDNAADQAFDNCGIVLDFYKKIFNWNSVDDKGTAIVSSVHYGKNLGNAYWSTTHQQMMYGDGDTQVLCNFTACLDVIGHELTV